MKKRGLCLSLLVLTAVLLFTGCQSKGDQLASKAVTITLSGESAEANSSSVQVEEGLVTITHHGIYRLTGELTAGQILVNCVDSGEVWLLLDQVSITNPHGACIYIQQADYTHISLLTDTENRLTDGTTYQFDPGDDEPNGTIFARDDLEITGEGKLTIDANFKNAIAAKDNLVISGGVYAITSVGHGIKGKDSLTITGGTIQIDADGDGLKSTNANGGTKGTVTITGGVVDILCGDEGIQAISDITISGGRVQIDSRNNGIRSGSGLILTGGECSIDAEDIPVEAVTETKTGGILIVNGVAQ